MCAYAAVATGYVRSNPDKAVKLGKVSIGLAVVGIIIGFTVLIVMYKYEDKLLAWAKSD